MLEIEEYSDMSEVDNRPNQNIAIIDQYCSGKMETTKLEKNEKQLIEDNKDKVNTQNIKIINLLINKPELQNEDDRAIRRLVNRLTYEGLSNLADDLNIPKAFPQYLKFNHQQQVEVTISSLSLARDTFVLDL